MSVRVKICGLRDEQSVRAAVDSGADFIGFVDYPKSPRHIIPAEAAKLIALLPTHVLSVLVTVNPTDEWIDQIDFYVTPDYIQLHGSESPARVRDIQKRLHEPKIIKVIPVDDAGDVKRASEYTDCADMLLFDTKAVSNPSPIRGEVRWGADTAHRYPFGDILRNARLLRQQLTDAEKLLWFALRREQLGIKFRKQHPIGEYIVDFVCLNPKLVIELDGGQHALEESVAYDQIRTQFLEQQGFKVFRFWNHEVLQNLDGVLSVLFNHIHSQTSPLPNPPPTGEGIVVHGGTGKTFDWSSLHDQHIPLPWMLSGGLNIGNIKEAISQTGARMVDVSSGVECAAGVKDAMLIKQFIRAAKSI